MAIHYNAIFRLNLKLTNTYDSACGAVRKKIMSDVFTANNC